MSSTSGDFLSLGTEGGGAPEGLEAELPDSPGLPDESWAGFGEAPEWRLGFPERWLFDSPDEEVSVLAFAWLFALPREWPLGFDFADDDFSGCAADSDFGEAVDGAGDSVVGACSPAGSGAGVEGGCACPAGGCPADGAWPA